MTVPVNRIHEYALLAEVSYLRWDLVNQLVDEEIRVALTTEDRYRGELSPSQARAFADRWSVVDHLPNTDTGFSSTLFRNADGRYVLAFRGTESFWDDLVVADAGDIVRDGLAMKQIVDMYNEYQRLSAPPGSSYQVATLRLLDDETRAYEAAFAEAQDAYGTGEGSQALDFLRARDDVLVDSGEVYSIEFVDSRVHYSAEDPRADASGSLHGQTLDAVTGHSLGGHLAMAFSRLFGVEALSINGAGFGATRDAVSLADTTIANLFSMLQGRDSFDAGSILNIYGDKGPELVSQDGPYLFQPGAHEAVFIESLAGTTLGHGSGQMTDALAVFDVLAGLVPSLGAAQPGVALASVSRILESAASPDDGSFGAVVDALADLLITDGSLDQVERETERMVSYAHLNRLVEAVSALPPVDRQLIDIAGFDSAQSLAEAATNDIALRYALVNIDAFAISGDDALYVPHTRNAELSLYSEAGGVGLTFEYLADRAAFVHELAYHHQQDIPLHHSAAAGVDYFDLAEGISLERLDPVDALIESRQRFVFGSAAADDIRGGEAGDRLFGGHGDDVLGGGLGADYMEGGAGHDTYRAGDGDLIFDVDGKGHVRFGDLILGIAYRHEGEVDYLDHSGELTYSLDESHGSLTVTRRGDKASLSIQGFDNLDLGIRLEQIAAVPQAPHEITLGTNESQVIYGEHQEVSDSTDWDGLNGFNRADHVSGLDGRDWIYAWVPPNRDSAGNYLGSAPDNDIVEGGAGKDFIFGGNGADVLYATTQADVVEIVRGGGEPGTEEGDFVSGEGGDDWLYGSGSTDGLFGGGGGDYLYAGAGDDHLYGDWQAHLTYGFLDTVDFDYSWLHLDSQGNITLAVDYVSATGDDHLYAGDGDDHAWGEAGDDVIFGGAGNDRLNGDIARSNADGTATVPGSWHGSDRLYGEGGDDTLIGNGGEDYLFGGDGNDWLEGDHRVVLAGDLPYHGDDHLHGDAGSDTLIGLGGADRLYGGDADDALYGDAPGLDPAYHGNDRLYGGAGNDLMVGGGGDDLLSGGAGSDRYEFSPGDGLDRIVDSDGGGQGDTVAFVGVDGVERVQFSLTDNELHMRMGDEGLVFADWDVSQFNGVQYLDADGALTAARSAQEIVSMVNFAPTVSQLASSEQVLEDSPLSISLRDVGFSDANGGRLMFSASLAGEQPLPPWLSFDDRSLLLSGMPGNDEVGAYSIVVNASDGYGGEVAHTLDLAIENVNDAPQLVAPMAPRSVTSGYGFVHDLSGYWTDVDAGDGLSFSVTLEDGRPLPEWISFDTTELTLNGLAPEGFSGELEIMTLATDRSGATSTAAYTATFRPPSESIEISELTLAALSVPASAGYYPYYLDRDYFEWQNGVLGDINGDGYDDYYFGSDTLGHTLYRPRLQNASGDALGDNAAVVQIVYGQAEGWSGASPRTTSFVLGSDAVFDQLGLPDMGVGKQLLAAYRLTPLGDVNADGFDDFALGERMFLGSASGLETSYSWEDLAQRPSLQSHDLAGVTDMVTAINVVLDGAEEILQAVGVGDINGDGLGDYVAPVRVSTYGTAFDSAQAAAGPAQQYPLQFGGQSDTLDALHVIYGRQDGPPDLLDLDQRDPLTGFDIRGFEQYVETREHNGIAYDVSRVSYGALVSGGDMDGDGINDIMISTLAGFRNSVEVPGVYHSDYAVRNYLLFGNTEAGDDIDLGALSAQQGLVQEYVPNLTAYGGRRVPGLIELGGDINGDGFNDAVSVTGDYAEADYGGRVDLKVLYGSDFRNNAAFQGDAEANDQVVVAKGGSVFTLGGNDSVLISPAAGSQRFDVETGAGNDVIEVSLTDASTGIHARLAGGAGSDAYSIRTASSLLGGAGGAGVPQNTIVIDDLSVAGYASGNSLKVGFGPSSGAGVAIPRLGFGSLLLTFSDLNLAIHLQNFDRDRVLEGPRDIDSFDFGNGVVLSYEELLAKGFDLEGSAADDLIEGSSVSDRIKGLAGADILIGGRGDDELDGGNGDDLLDGGVGDDVYRFGIGGDTDRITDAGGVDRIVFGEGLDIATATVRRTADDLEVRFASADTLVVSDWFAGDAGRVEQFLFDGGDSLNAAEVEQLLQAAGVTLSGTGSRDTLVGTDGDDHVYGHGGSDYLFGLAGDDLLVGGAGRDRLYGGPGDDTFAIAPGDGFDRFHGGDGYDRILGTQGDDRIGLLRRFGPNNGIEEIDGAAGYDAIVGTGSGDTLDFSATELNGIDEIRGARGSDTIIGTAADDRIVGGDGWDRLFGGEGNDSYIFQRGDDRDIIRDDAGEEDRLILADIDPGETWFSRQGDDLLVSVVGSYDRVRVDGWYADANARIEQIQAADGRYLTDAAVERLVSAMAAFDPLDSGITDAGIKVSEPLRAEIAAVWQTS